MATLLFRSPQAPVKASRVSKTQAGHFAKANVEAGRGQWEFRSGSTDEAFEVGSCPYC